jgi:ADP-ribose pyrophosphatase YjhB (NUDIX family)
VKKKLTVADAKLLLEAICAEHKGHDAEIMQGADGERLHALDVLAWINRFEPRASVSLKLAALFHDIDRVVNPKMGGGFKGDRSSRSYLLHKKRHARRSVRFIKPILLENGFPKALINRTEFLILHHDDLGEEVERIGDPELDHLVAADSFAFFTSIAPKLYAAEGPDRLRDKIQFMVQKLPENARATLWEHRLDHDVFEELKNDVIREYYLKNGRRERAYKYCPSCRKRLVRELINGRPHPTCAGCGFVFWNHAHPVTSVIIEDHGKILLVRRAFKPLQGYWCLPGGYIHYTELPQTAAIREVKEETNLDIQTQDLIGVYQIDNDPVGVNLDIIWTGLVLGGRLRTNEESTEAKYFDRNKLPLMIAYKHRQAIRDSDKEKGGCGQ